MWLIAAGMSSPPEQKTRTTCIISSTLSFNSSSVKNPSHKFTPQKSVTVSRKSFRAKIGDQTTPKMFVKHARFALGVGLSFFR
jgi:hypothetical protein